MKRVDPRYTPLLELISKSDGIGAHDAVVKFLDDIEKRAANREREAATAHLLECADSCADKLLAASVRGLARHIGNGLHRRGEQPEQPEHVTEAWARFRVGLQHPWSAWHGDEIEVVDESEDGRCLTVQGGWSATHFPAVDLEPLNEPARHMAEMYGWRPPGEKCSACKGSGIVPGRNEYEADPCPECRRA